MASHDQAVAAKPEVRRRLRRLGMVVVSLGVEDTPKGSRLAVGVAGERSNLPADFSVNDVPVRVKIESFGAVD